MLKPQDADGRSRLELHRRGKPCHGYVIKLAPRRIGEFKPVIEASFAPLATFMNALAIVRFSPGRSLVLHNLQVIDSSIRNIYQARDIERGLPAFHVWREEQKPVGKGGEEAGDMPHNWASAEFIRLTAHLLELDSGEELHLYEGLPPEWTRPGMVTKLAGVATPFGPLNLELRISPDGKTAHLQVQPLGPACHRLIVHMSGWAAVDPDVTREFRADRVVEATIPLAGP